MCQNTLYSPVYILKEYIKQQQGGKKWFHKSAHFTDEETEIWKMEVACPSFHSETPG